MKIYVGLISAEQALINEFTSSKEAPIPNGISECRSYAVSFIYAQIKELLFIYLHGISHNHLSGSPQSDEQLQYRH